MKKCNFVWLLVVAAALSVFFVYWSSRSPIAETVLRIDFTAKTCPIGGTQYFQTFSGTQLAATAIDQDGNFYVIGFKRDKAARASWNVVKADATGRIVGVFPLRRKNGRLIRSESNYLSVSPSGKYWWTVRKPFEDRGNPHGIVLQDYILTVYNSTGEPLQEWTHPAGVDLLQAVGEDEVYLAGSSQVWDYKIGEETAARRISTKLFVGQHMAPDGRFWRLEHPPNTTEPRQYTASVVEWGKAPQVFCKFKMQGTLSPFWHDPQVGLFFFQYLRRKDHSTYPDMGKIIYRVTADGTVHKLFVTSNTISNKPGQSLWTGQPIKADENFVWLEIGYYKGHNKGHNPTEYQIVKVPYQ